MKKNMYALVLCAMTLIGCQNTPSYTISGTVINDDDVKVVYLGYNEANGRFTALDSAKVTNGKFTFNGRQDSATFRILQYHKPTPGRMSFSQGFFLENGHITAVISGMQFQNSVTGTPNNDIFQKYINAQDALAKKWNEFQLEATNDTLEDEPVRNNKDICSDTKGECSDAKLIITKMVPQNDERLKKYKQDLSDAYRDIMENHLNYAVGIHFLTLPYRKVEAVNKYIDKLTEQNLRHPAIQQLLKQNEKKNTPIEKQ